MTNIDREQTTGARQMSGHKSKFEIDAEGNGR